MPSWTLGDLASAVTASLGHRSDIGLSTVSLWLNEAQSQMYHQMPFDTQEALAVSSTTVNEDKLSLPSDYDSIIGLSNLSYNNDLLDPLEQDQVMLWGSDTSGRPTHYALYSSWLELRPKPDSAYSLELRYRKQVSDMTALTSVPSLATRFRLGILLKGKELLAQHVIQDSEAAMIARDEYESFMGSLPNDRAKRMKELHALGCALPRSRGQTTQTSDRSFDTGID
jgi:hypothetical protein